MMTALPEGCRAEMEADKQPVGGAAAAARRARSRSELVTRLTADITSGNIAPGCALADRAGTDCGDRREPHGRP